MLFHAISVRNASMSVTPAPTPTFQLCLTLHSECHRWRFCKWVRVQDLPPETPTLKHEPWVGSKMNMPYCPHASCYCDSLVSICSGFESFISAFCFPSANRAEQKRVLVRFHRFSDAGSPWTSRCPRRSSSGAIAYLDISFSNILGRDKEATVPLKRNCRLRLAEVDCVVARIAQCY